MRITYIYIYIYICIERERERDVVCFDDRAYVLPSEKE